MESQFFSARIPQTLADQIKLHRETTGETQTELLLRLLRAEISVIKADNDMVEAVSNLQQRVAELERICVIANDNNTEAKPKRTRAKKVTSETT
jgi:hypothetical protein